MNPRNTWKTIPEIKIKLNELKIIDKIVENEEQSKLISIQISKSIINQGIEFIERNNKLIDCIRISNLKQQEDTTTSHHSRSGLR